VRSHLRFAAVLLPVFVTAPGDPGFAQQTTSPSPKAGSQSSQLTVSNQSIDLVPLPFTQAPGPTRYCHIVHADGKQRLAISVHNNGSADAPPSITHVDFYPGGPVDLPTPQVLANQTIIIYVDVPQTSSKGDWNFIVTTNYGNPPGSNRIGETNLKNNTVNGRCVS
jgi:hypothetical protein